MHKLVFQLYEVNYYSQHSIHLPEHSSSSAFQLHILVKNFPTRFLNLIIIGN